ncbi:hypothetical protein [Glaciecola sp. SC05]|uniref:hypothetical protein n=1 Tax=Glaciecola sp. SC05 TaxID=1987355 RepID=UPI0035271D19
MTNQLQRIVKKLDGDGPIEKHILLLKLTEALENAPEFGDKPVMEVASPQRLWLSKVGALLSRLNIERKVQFKTSFNSLIQHWMTAVVQIQGQVLDAIEEIKLELELEDRSDIGSAYAPGDVYRFFADLKEVINSAESEVLIVDPYFNGEAFEAYLSSADSELNIQILADRYSKDIYTYIEKHTSQFQTQIRLRRSKELHDRIIFIDHNVAWIIGGSIKDAGKKATYLIPIQTPIALAKKQIYQEIWNNSKEVECSA